MLRPEMRAKQRRYTLATALLIVRRMETTATRGAVFAEIKDKNRVYRLIDGLYERAGSRLLQPLALFAYMIKCLVSLGPFDATNTEAVSIASFPNEHKTIKRIAALVPHIGLLRVSSAYRHMAKPSNILIALRLMAAMPRLWPVLRRLANSYSFMPAARIASALAFYIRFVWLLKAEPALKAAIVTSNYSPDAVGLAAAAHKLGRRVVYANHAPVPVNGAFVPPVLADCGLFYGDTITRSYKALSECHAEVGLIGQPIPARSMEWRDQIETVGIFLTAGTRMDVLRSLVATIRLSHPGARVLIRQHPVALLKTNFAELEVDDANVALTIGNPLEEEIAACDLVVCGNSGVALNVLSAGRPVAYLSSLDSVPFDYNGFVASRLVYSMPWWSDDLYQRLQSFYQTPGWRDVMQSYDASFGADIDEVRSQAGLLLERHIRGGPSVAPASLEDRSVGDTQLATPRQRNRSAA